MSRTVRVVLLIDFLYLVGTVVALLLFLGTPQWPAAAVMATATVGLLVLTLVILRQDGRRP